MGKNNARNNIESYYLCEQFYIYKTGRTFATWISNEQPLKRSGGVRSSYIDG